MKMKLLSSTGHRAVMTTVPLGR